MAASAETAADPAVAWAAYEPSPQRPWDLTRAAHLLRRAGFGPTWGELQQALKLGPAQTIDGLLRGGDDAGGFNKDADGLEEGASAIDSARGWWLRRILLTPHPLLEKLTLFWHDYFAVSAAGQPDASLLVRHVRTLRAGAFGDFRELVAQVLRDPATFLSLGATANRKARPEDHVARQLLHRYTVGPDACGDGDVRDAARAMTGWFVLNRQLRYIPREHDDGDKTVLGKTGRLDAQDVAKLAASHPAAARNVVRRLFRWFISEADEASDATLAPLAAAFAKDFDVARLVGTMLRSNLFFSPAAIRRRVKRPVELAGGIVRSLEAAVGTTRLAADLAALGEALYSPPTSDGWAAGRCWLNHATIIGRGKLAASLLAPSGPYDGRCDPAATARRHGQADSEAARRFLADLFLQSTGDGPPGGVGDQVRQVALRLVERPEFQLA